MFANLKNFYVDFAAIKFLKAYPLCFSFALWIKTQRI